MGFVKQFQILRQRSFDERAAKRTDKFVVKDMPYVYGLMCIAMSSGLSPHAALGAIVDYVPHTCREHMTSVLSQIEKGRTFRDALTTWDSYPHLRPLAHILIESMESGTSSLSSLDALGRDAMNRVRRETETAVKKLPVTMLFPLVTCILPAFILLSVTPTLVNGFMSFHW